MSAIRIQTKGEGRWYVAYLRYLAGQRESLPVANHTHYGFIPPGREALLTADAEGLAQDLGLVFEEVA